MEDRAESNARAFSLLPTQLNVLGTVAATGAGYVFVGRLAAAANDSWTVSVQDYASPVGQARFAVGDMTNTDEGLHWPLYQSVSSEPATEDVGPTTNELSAEMCARVEAGSGTLSLWLPNPQDEELLNALSLCGLVVENNLSRHHVQLSLPESIPPVALSLDKSKQTIAFEEMPSLARISAARLELEVLQVLHGANEILPASGARAGYNKELTVTLDSSLQCELGFTLTKSGDQAEIAIAPRYLRNDRKLPMVPTKLTREISRSKSQLIENQRDLAEAQNALRRLPQEISRVRGMAARSAPEAAYKQSQLGRLSSMLNSAQSRTRRLAKVNPEMTQSIAQMERVLRYANQLASNVTIHFRVFARGEKGEFLLLVAASEASLNASASGE